MELITNKVSIEKSALFFAQLHLCFVEKSRSALTYAYSLLYRAEVDGILFENNSCDQYYKHQRFRIDFSWLYSINCI